MQELKILVSAIKEPFWKYNGFGLKRYHFEEAKRIRCHCDYKKKDGTLLYPHYYEIDSDKAKRVGIHWSTGDLLIIPVQEFDISEQRR